MKGKYRRRRERAQSLGKVEWVPFLPCPIFDEIEAIRRFEQPTGFGPGADAFAYFIDNCNRRNSESLKALGHDLNSRRDSTAASSEFVESLQKRILAAIGLR